MSGHVDPVHGLGPCVGCGHDPACGFSLISVDDQDLWLCHTDDHSCYVGASLSLTGPGTAPTELVWVRTSDLRYLMEELVDAGSVEDGDLEIWTRLWHALHPEDVAT